MKNFSYTFTFVFCLFSLPLYGANRTRINQKPDPKQKETVSPMPVSVTVQAEPDPLQEDKKTDIILFNHFIKILANFGHILLDPHNTVNVTLNAAKMIDGVVSVTQELTKRGNPHPNERQIKNIIRLILLALQKQGFLLQQPHQIESFGYSIS